MRSLISGLIMELKYGFISADDHVQEHPELWTSRLSRQKWGERIPHIEEEADGSQSWVIDGRRVPLPGIAVVGALMSDRAKEPKRWNEVPPMAFGATDRLKAMD